MSDVLFSRDMLDRMFRYCRALTGEEAGAYDLLQDGLERYLRLTDPAEHPEALLRRILRNRFIDTRRAARRWGLEPLQDDAGALSHGFHGLEEILIVQDDLARIWLHLTPLERELLHLWAVEGYTVQEIAELVDEPRGTLLSRLHRLRRRMLAWQAEQTQDAKVLT